MTRGESVGSLRSAVCNHFVIARCLIDITRFSAAAGACSAEGTGMRELFGGRLQRIVSSIIIITVAHSLCESEIQIFPSLPERDVWRNEGPPYFAAPLT